MDENRIIFKGSKNGIIIDFDKDMEFGELIELLQTKVKESEDFFAGVKSGIVLAGREFNCDEENQVIKVLKEHSKMKIEYITTNENLTMLNDTKNIEDEKKDYSQTLYYHGNLRSGQCLEYDASIVVFGDINPGSEIIAGGNIVVMGSLRGSAQAGMKSTDAYIIAFDMNPKQLRIGNLIARSADDGDDVRIKKPHKAYVKEEKIYIDPIDGTFTIQ